MQILSPPFLNKSKAPQREKIYIIKDLISKLVEWGELNQTNLISYCGLNLSKHRQLVAELSHKGLIEKEHLRKGRRIITVYRPTIKGIVFYNEILEGYERVISRSMSERSKSQFQSQNKPFFNLMSNN